MRTEQPLRIPFVHFGAKWRAAHLIWERIGADVSNYVEAFAGRADILMARPNGAGKIETINDLDGLLTNALRGIKYAPDAVADECQWPVSELCLHAKHRRLVRAARETDLIERLRNDDEFCDPKLAGLWIWGRCCWIGSGWCASAMTAGDPLLARQVSHLSSKQGVTSARFDEMPSNQMPHIGGTNTIGLGVHRGEFRDAPTKLPFLAGGANSAHYGHGVLKGEFREPSNQMPQMGSGGGKGVNYGTGVFRGDFRDGLYHKMPEVQSARGVFAAGRLNALHAYLRRCADRLRHVRIVCGDWRRVTGDSVTILHGTTAMVFDPPYIEGADGLYAAGDKSIAADVVEWCREHQDDRRYLIALCGFEGNYDLPGWDCVSWKARAGYGVQRKSGPANDNRKREVIWFSPSCLKPSRRTPFAAGRPLEQVQLF